MRSIVGHFGMLQLARSTQVTRDVVVPETLSIQAERSQAAAWLVREYRRAFRRDGVVDFKVPKGAKIPNWFVVALDVLSTRQRWEVAYWSSGVQCTYRVKWLGKKSRTKS